MRVSLGVLGFWRTPRSLTAALTAALLAAAATWGIAAAPGEAATITFKCSTATLNDVQHEWCKRYGARLEKRSNGRIKAQTFPANQLGSIPRQIEGVQLGTIESWIGPPEFLVGIDSRFQVLTAPYLFNDMDHAYRVINDREFLDKFLVLAEGKGVKGVSLIVYGPAGFNSRTPVRTPDDLRGKKIRVLATPIETAMMAALGATGVPMPLGEVLPALQQGALDGVESSLTVFTTFKYYDVAKWHTNTNHYTITSIATVSKKWYDGLPADLQRAVVEEGRAVHAELLDWTKNFYNQGVTVWKEKTKDGWIELTAEQRAAFRKPMEGVDEKVAGQVAGVKEWLDLLRAKSKQHAK
jgi:TRAP-type C4-dicarboxylate transport system substrate-binding protein